MQTDDFKLHDVSRFPIVVLHGRDLPQGYGPAWVREMDALLSQQRQFILIFPNSIENEGHDDQKLRTVYLKANKERLASRCDGVFGVEPSKALRIVKRGQGAAIALAFGLRFRVAPTFAEAERLARLALDGQAVPEDAERE